MNQTQTETMRELLRKIAYPHRGTDEEQIDIFQAAEIDSSRTYAGRFNNRPSNDTHAEYKSLEGSESWLVRLIPIVRNAETRSIRGSITFYVKNAAQWSNAIVTRAYQSSEALYAPSVCRKQPKKDRPSR